uniref:Cilia- and flagella-associated protein 299 n=1 Tax=Leptobrachium leishanense TaxID=445787 RepID=A0A8C5MLB3_9ANUR
MEMEGSGAVMDGIVTEFNTYEDFLDSQITPLDLYYLEDEELARQLVELGYRGSGEVLKREEFEARKAAVEASRLSQRTQQNICKKKILQLQRIYSGRKKKHCGHVLCLIRIPVLHWHYVVILHVNVNNLSFGADWRRRAAALLGMI